MIQLTWKKLQTIWVCPLCGEIWAAAKDGSPGNWVYDHCPTPCEDCNRAWKHHITPGSLLDTPQGELSGWNEELLKELPLELLKREYAIHDRFFGANAELVTWSERPY